MALSNDLRLLVVAAYQAGNEGYEKVAQRFGVAVCSVRRWVELFNETATVDKRPQTTNNPSPITTEKLSELVALVQEKPDRTVQELADIWNERNGTNISRSSMTRALQRAGVSLKKRRFVQQNATRLTSNRGLKSFCVK
jgi:transposase